MNSLPIAPPRILLLTPAFHGYEASISRGFDEAGWPVYTHTYDAHPRVRDKVLYKVERELPRKLRLKSHTPLDARASRSAAATIRRIQPDITLVIKGDIFTDVVYEALDDVGSRRILWLYDELRRTIHRPETLAQYEAIITYSRSDWASFAGQGLTTIHVHNGFDPSMRVSPQQCDPVLFIGARYDRREELLRRVHDAGVPLLCVGRDWSSHPYDRIRTWRLRGPSLPGRPDIGRAAGYALTAGAPAAINIHRDQDGFTMKTFEVPGVGGVQLIDRPDVAELYEPGREVLVYETPEELIELAARCVADRSWAQSMREAGQKRTLAHHTFAHRARQVAQLWA